jgi:hypothetical protein
MQSKSQSQLSLDERKVRIDAVAVALRSFRLVDDGSISKLFFSTAYPSERALARAIRRLSGFVLSSNPQHIASILLSDVANSDANRALLLPPSVGSPKLIATSAADLDEVAGRIIYQLKHAVEQQALWRELWNGAFQCTERRCQALFKLAATCWCQAYDIDLSAEVDFGRGPVDFKMSCGWNSRALIEVKLASNSKFWNGIRKQLPQYLKSEKIANGYFVPFIFEASHEKLVSEIGDVAKEVSLTTGYRIEVVVIDARRDNKKSASKL